MNKRILLGVLVALGLVACGDKNDKKSGGTTAEANLPASICPMTPLVGQTNASSYRSLDHDGGNSDLYMEWEAYRQQAYICSGDYTFKLRASNVSQHSEAKRVWFTVIFYHGNEYIENYSISPQGITIPVGATQEFDFTMQVNEAFASADDRDITAAIIIQTDNPNFSDPDAFFTRTWLRLVPASDCNAEPMVQPAPHNISVHSVTCQDATVLLQTHESLMNGYPQAEIVSGDVSLNGGVYQEGKFFYQSVHIDGTIPEGSEAEIDLFTDESDRVRFFFKERVDCAWLPKPPPPAPEPEPETPPVTTPPEEPPAEEPGEGTDRTVLEEFAAITACGMSVPDALVPPAAAPVTGTAWKKVEADGRTSLVVTLDRLPEPSVGEGDAEGWVGSVDQGVYAVWLVREEKERMHFVPVATFSADEGGKARVTYDLNPDKVAGLAGSSGVYVGAGGVLDEKPEAAPLKSFDGIVVTLQPSDELEKPNGVVMGSGSRTR